MSVFIVNNSIQERQQTVIIDVVIYCATRMSDCIFYITKEMPFKLYSTVQAAGQSFLPSFFYSFPFPFILTDVTVRPRPSRKTVTQVSTDQVATRPGVDADIHFTLVGV